MERPSRWRVAWITGASSGIGKSLTDKLSAMGVAVAVTARSKTTLEAMAAAHPNVRAYPADVTDTQAMGDCARQVAQDLGPIDLAIFSAGVFRPGSSARLSAEDYLGALAINYGGCINGFVAVRDQMLARKAGQIAFISSVAGFAGLPNQSAYGPTKAALINLAEALQSELEPEGVKVSVVNPGFIETPMTANNPRPMPFIVNLDYATDQILAGLAKERFEITFPPSMKINMKLLKRAPYSIYFPIARMIEARQVAGAEAKAAAERDKDKGS